MKVLLLQPPIRDFYQTDVRLQPLGLCYLKSTLKKHAPEVEVIVRDYHSGCGRRTVAMPSELTHLRRFYPQTDRSPFRTFSRFYHFGADFSRIAKEVAAEAPDLVGISALFSAYSEEALETARAIKSERAVPIVMGGAHVSAVPQDVLAEDAVDFVVVGEGEKPLLNLVRAFQSQAADPASIPNLGFKRQGRLFVNPRGPNFDVDDIPVPDLSDLGSHRYTASGLPITFVVTSRGCPYHCAFCSVSAVFERGFRPRTPAAVCEEVLLRYGEGYRVIDFEDDNLAFDAGRFSQILEGLIDAVPSADLRLTAMNGICYQNLDREILLLMRRAGFKDLNLSLVTADPDQARLNRRPHDVETFSRVVNLACRLGFRVVGYQILGLPGDSVSSMVDTMLFLARLPLLIGASPFYLAPGCEWCNQLQSSPGRRSWTGARTTAMGWDSTEFGRPDIFTLFVTARILNFLKGVRFSEDGLPIQGLLRSAKGAGRTRWAGE